MSDGRFCRWLSRYRGGRSWRTHANTLRDQWQRLVDPSVLETLDPVSKILDSLAELDRFSLPVSSEEFISAFSEALRRARADGTGAVHGVSVMGAMDARGEPFRVLFLIGLKEGVFPRVVREDPLLNDDARRFLRDPGGYWILPKREGHDEEKLLFTLLISSAQEHLYLVYSRSGEEGRAEIPSLYLRTLARAVGLDLDEAQRVPRPPLAKWTSVPAKTLTLREAALADVLEGRDPPGHWGETVRLATQLVGWDRPGPWDGRVGAPESFLDRCVRRGLSPSAVETLANCPFEFFMGQVLGIREPRPFYDEDGPLPAAVGSLQHALLHKVYDDFSIRGVPDPAAAADHLQKVAGPFFAGAINEGAGPYPLVWVTVVDRLTRRLAEFIQRDVTRLTQEGARPDKLEWALKAPLAGTDFFWNGRIDRVDYSAQTGRWTVVDYKNKIMKDPLVKRVVAGLAHQAPAYLEMVAAQGVWGPGAVCGGVRFESLTAPETDILSGEEWDKHGPALVNARAQLLSKVRNGEFLIHPTDGPGSHCSLCGFARACRKAHGPTRRRALGAIEPEEDIVP
ncbi:MAG: exodeoxyribonuclease V subunit gamma [Elusimicrobia bacterium]|nr:exodeoxyribonuclease V subunit gamma [Elusimicrobiota bacterium]